MTSCWAIIPVKSLQNGKSRLSTYLSLNERKNLNNSLLVNTIKVLSANKNIDLLIVVSQDLETLDIARIMGVNYVFESGSPDLNNALNQAILEAKKYNIDKVIIIPADIPLVTNKEVDEIINLSGEPPEIVIVPDRRKEGTNVLLINPPDCIKLSYGENSFSKHIGLAKDNKTGCKIYESNCLGLDLDIEDDFNMLNEFGIDNVNSELEMVLHNILAKIK